MKIDKNNKNEKITFNNYPPPTTGLQFPVYLVEGDNGQLGIDVYNYLYENCEYAKYYTLPDNIIIYINSYRLLEIGKHSTKQLSLYTTGNSGHLKSDGIVTINHYSGGAD